MDVCTKSQRKKKNKWYKYKGNNSSEIIPEKNFTRCLIFLDVEFVSFFLYINNDTKNPYKITGIIINTVGRHLFEIIRTIRNSVNGSPI